MSISPTVTVLVAIEVTMQIICQFEKYCVYLYTVCVCVVNGKFLEAIVIDLVWVTDNQIYQI